MKRCLFAIILPLALIMFSCSKSAEYKAEIVRLDNAILHSDFEDIASYLPAFNTYIHMLGLNHIALDNDSAVQAAIERLQEYPAVEIFSKDVENLLPDIKPEEYRLGELNSFISSNLPSIPSPIYIGIVSPYRQHIVIDSSYIFIALNHYLGREYPGYDGLPQYQRELKEVNRIPIDVAEAIIASNFPYRSSEGATAINRLLYEGALAHAVISAIPGMTIAEYQGWNNEEHKFAESNLSSIWRTMAADKLLYSTDPAVISRLIERAPATAVISPQTPGRIGRYIGYLIVKKWLENNPETDFSVLLSPEFYGNTDVLVEANFAP